MATQLNQDSTLIWRKSSVSADGGNCVEVAESESFVLVRYSRDRSRAILRFGPDQWRGFIGRFKSRDAICG